MVLRFPADVERALSVAFQATLVLWLGLSVYVVANRVLYNRRARRLSEVARQIANQAHDLTAPLQRSAALDHVLARLPRRVLYQLIADVSAPTKLTDVFAAYALERWVLPRTLRDASARPRRGKWRRISALFALGYVRAAGIHDLLERALFDADAEVASAAVVILHRLGDRRAAEILIAGLRARAYQPSRIATQLDQFAIPIDALLRPLLADPLPHVRYWAVSLLAKYSDVSFATEIAALADDPDAAVRKAVRATLSAINDAAAAPVALRGLDDPVPYVRATAIRALAKVAADEPDSGVRREYAGRIAPLLADREWDVRFAAKESLVAFGPSIWREVSAQLDAPDKFARNGAAEVLQNIGLLDQLIDEVGHGSDPSADVLSVLERSFREGGAGMIDAAAARSNPALFPSIENLLTRLRFVGVRIS